MQKGLHRLTSRREAGPLALIALAVCLLAADFGYGLAQGSNDTLFHPIYRVRQSVAIAVSRAADPSAEGYLAHQSVVSSLNRDGFAVFAQDEGPAYDLDRTTAMLLDGDQLDAAIENARQAPIDTDLPPSTLGANALGYPDYFSAAFSLFGFEVGSLYYFYFLLVFVSAAMYVAEFRRDSFHLFLLSLYLAGLLFVHDYAQHGGAQLQAIQNSRLFGALALLPAAHVGLLVWPGRTFTPLRVGLVAGQALIFAFVLSARTTVMWEFGMVMLVAGLAGLATLWRLRLQAGGALLRRLAPAAVLALVVTGYSAQLDARTAAPYETQSSGHIVWHNVLQGLLTYSPGLRMQYMEPESTSLGDQMSYDAVMFDLNQKGDASPQVAFAVDGRIYIAPDRNWAEYDRLARAVVLQIVAERPGEFILGLFRKLGAQFSLFFDSPVELYAKPLILFVIIGAAAVTIGVFSFRPADIAAGAVGVVLVPACSLLPALIMPSRLSVEIALVFLIAIAVALTFAAAWYLTPGARGQQAVEDGY